MSGTLSRAALITPIMRVGEPDIDMDHQRQRPPGHEPVAVRHGDGRLLVRDEHGRGHGEAGFGRA